MKQIIYVINISYGCPYCGHVSEEIFPVEHDDSDDHRIFKCPECGNEVSEYACGNETFETEVSE